MKRTLIALLILIGVSVRAEQMEINTLLMHDTFKIEGPAREPGKVCFGTVFIVTPPPDLRA